MLHEIDKQLREIEQSLYDIEKDYATVARNAAQARFAYDIAYAEAMDTLDHRVLAEGEKKPTVAILESQAVIMVKDQMGKARTAEAELNVLKVLINSLQSRLSSTQTRAKMIQIEADLTHLRT